MMHEFIVIAVITVVCCLLVLPAFLWPGIHLTREELQAYRHFEIDCMVTQSLLAQMNSDYELDRSAPDTGAPDALEEYQRVMNMRIK